MRNTEKLYLDRNGYEQYLKEIDLLKEKLNEINLGRKEAFEASAGDGWDSPEFEEIERQERLILGSIKRMYEGLQNVVIIERHEDIEIIDIGDTLLVILIFSLDDTKELIFKLVGTSGNLTDDVQEISINSPLGNAVYKKKIGEQTNYNVNGRNVSVLIKEKLNLEKLQDESTNKIKK